MKIQKNAAVALFVALGLKNADKWNDARLAAKLGKIKEMVDDDVKLEGAEQELLTGVMAAAAAGEEFEIEGGEPAAATEQVPGAEKAQSATKQTDEEKAAKAKEKADKAAAKDADKAAKAAAKEKEKADRLAAKAAAKAAKEVLKGTGEDRVLPIKMKAAAKAGKYEIAGQVLAEFGMPDEITDKMCDRFIELFGLGNRSNAAFYLIGAWKAVTTFRATKPAEKAG